MMSPTWSANFFRSSSFCFSAFLIASKPIKAAISYMMTQDPKPMKTTTKIGLSPLNKKAKPMSKKPTKPNVKEQPGFLPSDF